MLKNLFVICGLIASTAEANSGFKPGKCPERPHSYVNKKKLT